jgi:hypothetical protein
MTDDSADQAGKDSRRLATLACATALLTALCGSPVRADTATPNAAEAAPVADYSDPAHWICRPGRADACAVDLDATIIAEDGSMTREAFHADPNAPVDCFYVYPTVSHEPTGNADFAIDRDLTRTVAQQFARFGARCRLFAPVYRQITIPGLTAFFSGKPMPMSRELAYADVLAAWRFYLANDNHGRGFVLVGHSQGTGVLSQLVREEIDGKPIQSQMVSALLLGGGGRLATPRRSYFPTRLSVERMQRSAALLGSRRFARKPRRSQEPYLRRRPRARIRPAPTRRRCLAARGCSTPTSRLRARP